MLATFDELPPRNRAAGHACMHVLPDPVASAFTAIGKRPKARGEGGEIAFRNRESNLRRRIVTLSLRRRILSARAERIELVEFEAQAQAGGRGIEERNERKANSAHANAKSGVGRGRGRRRFVRHRLVLKERNAD